MSYTKGATRARYQKEDELSYNQDPLPLGGVEVQEPAVLEPVEVASISEEVA